MRERFEYEMVELEGAGLDKMLEQIEEDRR